MTDSHSSDVWLAEQAAADRQREAAKSSEDHSDPAPPDLPSDHGLRRTLESWEQDESEYPWPGLWLRRTGF
jgi:hypothetical protein